MTSSAKPCRTEVSVTAESSVRELGLLCTVESRNDRGFTFAKCFRLDYLGGFLDGPGQSFLTSGPAESLGGIVLCPEESLPCPLTLPAPPGAMRHC